MSDVTSMSGLTAKMLLAKAFIDGHVDDNESKFMIEIINKFEDVDVEEQVKIIDSFHGLDAEGVINNITPEITAIATAADDDFKRMMLVSMSLVALADGEEHGNEQALIKTCKEVWGV